MKKSNTLLLVSIIIVTAMIYLRDFGYANFSSVQVAAVSIGLALFLPYNEFMAYNFFLFPIGSGLPCSYMTPLLCILWIVKYKKKLNRSYISFFVFFALLELVHFFLYTFDKEFLFMVRYLSSLFLFVMFFSDESQKEEHNRRALYYCIGVVVLVVGVLTNTNNLIGSISEYGGRVGDITQLDESLSGVIRLSVNPNGLAFFSITATVISLSFLLQKKYNTLAVGAILAVSVIAGLLSMSRTWVLVMALTCIMYLFTHSVSKKGKIMGLFFIFIVSIFLLKGNEIYLEGILGRFGNESASTGGSRTELFSYYHKFMFEHVEYLFFGTGAAYYSSVVNAINSVHNAIQQVFVSYGVVGLIIFVVAAIKIYMHNKKTLVFWLPAICVLLFMQSIQFLNPFASMYPILVAFQVVKGAKTENNENYILD